MKLRLFSKPKKLYLIMMAFVAVLLVYANGLTFNLFSAPSFANDIIAFSVLGVAVVFTIITLTVIVRDVPRKDSILEMKLPVTETPKPEEASVRAPFSSFFKNQAVEVQKSENKNGNGLSEDNQLFKRLKAEPTMLICPSCRKMFKMPAYLGELLVDFGPKNASNLLKECPNCGATIALKQKIASAEVEK
jgi:hypothetical protein